MWIPCTSHQKSMQLPNRVHHCMENWKRLRFLQLRSRLTYLLRSKWWLTAGHEQVKRKPSTSIIIHRHHAHLEVPRERNQQFRSKRWHRSSRRSSSPLHLRSVRSLREFEMVRSTSRGCLGSVRRVSRCVDKKFKRLYIMSNSLSVLNAWNRLWKCIM